MLGKRRIGCLPLAIRSRRDDKLDIASQMARRLAIAVKRRGNLISPTDP
jgi:hypothetical protein